MHFDNFILCIKHFFRYECDRHGYPPLFAIGNENKNGFFVCSFDLFIFFLKIVFGSTRH